MDADPALDWTPKKAQCREDAARRGFTPRLRRLAELAASWSST